MNALSESVKGFGKVKIGALAVVATAMLAFFILLAFRASNGGMVPIYSGLSLEDSGKIVAELEKNGISYELVANGTQIMVPSDKVLRLRIDMAGQGLPSGGSIVGYEIFDRSETLGTSNFVMNVNMARALEGELGRTIASIAGIDTARVHLVMPQKELFTREKEKPSASVTIKMRGNEALEHPEVNAITHLVASAVPGLLPSKVTIVDSHGRLLARGDGTDGMDATAATAQEFRVAYESRTQQKLEDMLEKVVGAGKVRVEVAADINFDRTVTNSEKFDPDGQVARSTQSTSQRESAKEKAGKDNVSVANNLPQAAAANDGGNTSDHTTEHSDETTNFEISKTVQNHIQEGGNVNRMSVAVLVDGTYITNADGKDVYTPRTGEELKQLKTLISSSVGYDEKRGDKVEVVNMRFTQESFNVTEPSFFERFKVEMQPIIQTLIIGVVAVLAILLVLRPAVTQMIKQMQTPGGNRLPGDMAGALEGPGGMALGRIAGGGGNALSSLMGGGGGGGMDSDMLVDVANIKGAMKSSSMKRVNEIVDKYPEEAMGVLRQWIVNPAAR